jgi:hypothetical protein
MPVYPNWAIVQKDRNLFHMVQVAMEEYSSIFARTIWKIEEASDPIKSRFSIDHDSPYGQTLLEKARGPCALTILEFRDLANSIALHLANSSTFAKAVSQYWKAQVDILNCQHDTVLNNASNVASWEQVFYVSSAADLAEKLARVTRFWEEANDARIPLLTKQEIKWEHSSSSFSSSKVGDSDDEDSVVLEDAAPAIPERDKSPVRTGSITTHLV